MTYQCQACGKPFGNNKTRYKKHINHCPMPKAPPPTSQKLAIQFQQKIQELRAEYEVPPPQQQVEQPPVQQQEIPWFFLPPAQRLLQQFQAKHSPQYIQEIQLFHHKTMKEITEEVCRHWGSDTQMAGLYQFQMMLKSYPNYRYNDYRIIPFDRWMANLSRFQRQRQEIWFQRNYYNQKLNRKPIVKPVPKQGQYPLKYLLDDNWYDGKPVEWNPQIVFPEQAPQFRWGEFKTNIANFIATYRRLGDHLHLLPYIKDLDFTQATTPSRYLLNKTIQQWQHGRVQHLILKKHRNPYWHARLEKQTVISMQKWHELALYYERTIPCANGATFLTQLPHQAQERNYSTIRRKEMPNIPPQLPVILPPKVKQIRKSIAERVDEIRQRKEERQKIKRKKEANGQLPKKKKRELFELAPQESSQLAINELQSSQIHPIEQVYEQSSS